MLGDKPKEIDNCCAPQRRSEKSSEVRHHQKARIRHEDVISLDGGDFLLGTNSSHGRPQDGEMPIVQAHVLPFAIDRYAVTNSQYLTFIADVRYTCLLYTSPSTRAKRQYRKTSSA